MYCVDEDHVFITERFYIANFIKISRLILKSLFITFVLGIIWYIFSATTHMFKFGEDSEEFELDGDHGHETQTFIRNDSWDITMRSI